MYYIYIYIHIFFLHESIYMTWFEYCKPCKLFVCLYWLVDWLVKVLCPYIFALYRLTRARQKPGRGNPPYSFRFIPRGLLGARNIDSAIHHWAFIIFLPVHLTGILPQRGSNPRPSDHEPGALPHLQPAGDLMFCQMRRVVN